MCSMQLCRYVMLSWSCVCQQDGLKVTGQERLRHRLVKSATVMFNSRGSLPSQSSPVSRMVTVFLKNFLYPPIMQLGSGGILESGCPCVHLSVYPSVVSVRRAFLKQISFVYKIQNNYKEGIKAS